MKVIVRWLQDLFIPSAISLVVPLALMSLNRWVEISGWKQSYQLALLHSSWKCFALTNTSFSLCSELDTDKKVGSPSLTSEQMAPRGQLVFAVGIGALLFVPVFKSLTGLPPYLGMLLGLGTLWLLTDAIHYGETGRQQLKVPQALSRIDTQGVLFFLGILLSVGRWVLLELLATPICSSTFRSLNTHATKVDGHYLVALFSVCYLILLK